MRLDVPWHEVLRVSWSEDGRTIRWALTAEPSLERTADVQAPRNLPAVIRERIEQTFLIRQPVELAPGKVATVAARRPADGSGIVAWTVIPGRGVDLSRPALREAADRQLEALRRVWG